MRVVRTLSVRMLNPSSRALCVATQAASPRMRLLATQLAVGIGDRLLISCSRRSLTLQLVDAAAFLVDDREGSVHLHGHGHLLEFGNVDGDVVPIAQGCMSVDQPCPGTGLTHHQREGEDLELSIEIPWSRRIEARIQQEPALYVADPSWKGCAVRVDVRVVRDQSAVTPEGPKRGDPIDPVNGSNHLIEVRLRIRASFQIASVFPNDPGT